MKDLQIPKIFLRSS